MRLLSSPVPAAQSASGRVAPVLCHTATEETTSRTPAGSSHSRGHRGVQSMNRVRAAAVAAPTSLIRKIQRDLASGARTAAQARRHCEGATVPWLVYLTHCLQHGSIHDMPCCASTLVKACMRATFNDRSRQTAPLTPGSGAGHGGVPSKTARARADSAKLYHCGRRRGAKQRG